MLRITWAAAADDTTPPTSLRYRVYASVHAGGAAARPPAVVTEPGATSAYIVASPQGVRHFVVVRALDADGREDGNTIEKSAVAVPDEVAPVFSGVRNASRDPSPAGC